MKRPLRLQWWIPDATPPQWETSNGAFGSLDYAIKEAKRHKADRIIDMTTKREVWTAADPAPLTAREER